jgi:peptidoglycan/xylan/chitin deacetylase (PgdA/CDA1 family)
MYHNFCQSNQNSIGLTISVEKFEEQIKFLITANYKFYFASEIDLIDLSLKKNVIITFDDVTKNQLEYAMPILEKYKIKATFFVPFGFVGKKDFWNNTNPDLNNDIMTINELKSLNKNYVELGHHSFNHQKFDSISSKDIQEDFDKSFQFINENKLSVQPIIAYPYGKFPKIEADFNTFEKTLIQNGIKFGFRIGNKLNKLPLKNKFKVKRIDVLGQDKLWKFKIKLKYGKLLF